MVGCALWRKAPAMADLFSRIPMPAPRGQRDGGGGRRSPREQEPREFDSRTLELARVTRVTKGGKRMRFRALVIVGDHKGRVGFALAKGADVQMSVDKATRKAQKAVVTIPFVRGTIPHAVEAKWSAAKILLKPAPKGTGIKAGGAVRAVLEIAGVPNVVSKILGSGNKINNVKATFVALSKLSRGLPRTSSTAPTNDVAA